MKAVHVEDFSKPVKVVEVPVPKINENQVLVKLSYAPINPADVLSTQGKYLTTSVQPTPFIVGFEGSGHVVEVGKNFEAKFKPGDRVYYLNNGTWCEYAAIDGNSCHVLPEDAPIDVAACSFVNPMTVYYMMLELKAEGHNSVVHTAGSSALGRMFIRVMKEHGIKTVNLVRSDEYIAELKEIGADYVLNTNDDDFDKNFKELVASLDCRKVYDAIGGQFTGKLVWLMPKKSNISVYGRLSGDYQTRIDFWALLSQSTNVTGFWLSEKIPEHSQETIGKAFQTIFTGLKGTYASKIQKVFKLEEVAEAIKYSNDNGSKGKVLLSPDGK